MTIKPVEAREFYVHLEALDFDVVAKTSENRISFTDPFSENQVAFILFGKMGPIFYISLYEMS